jgi:mannitol operon transcriptional antiterminator
MRRTARGTTLKQAISQLDLPSRAILEELLGSPRHLSAAEVASALGLTPRMVRYRVNQLRHTLAGVGLVFETTPHLGIRVIATERTRALALQEVQRAGHQAFGLGKRWRVEEILCRLLLARRPLVAKELASSLGVSRTTVLGDMARVEGILHEVGLCLTRRSRTGFEVRGEERGIREALVDLVIGPHEERAPLILRCAAEGKHPEFAADRALAPSVSDLLGRVDLAFADRLVNQAQRRLGIRYTDRAYASLVVHLAIQLDRVKSGSVEGVAAEALEAMRRQREFQAAEWIVTEMGQHLGMAMPVGEIAYACLQLACHRISMPKGDLFPASGADALDDISVRAAEQMASVAAKYLHPSLQVDDLLQRSLAAHLRATINRMRWGLPIRNPLLAEIQAENPHVYEVARACAALLEAMVPGVVPDAEVGFICMHLAAGLRRHLPPRGLRRKVMVVCGEGIATAWMLVSRLAAEFPAVEVSEILSAQDLQVRSSYGDVDGIISTIQIERCPIPMVVVSPMLTWSDRRKVSEVLGLAVTGSGDRPLAPREGSQDLERLLGCEKLQVGVTAADWREVVEKSCWPLIRDGCVEERYVGAVKELIERYGPFMVLMPGVALLHAHPDDGVRELCLAVTTLRVPVAFGHETNDPVRVTVVVGAVDSHSHIHALRQLVGILEDTDLRAQAASAGSPAELRAILLGRGAGPVDSEDLPCGRVDPAPENESCDGGGGEAG